MQTKTEVQINAFKSEKNSSLIGNAERTKSGHQFRKPAIYRSVGIRVPGNNSLMVVHVTEY